MNDLAIRPKSTNVGPISGVAAIRAEPEVTIGMAEFDRNAGIQNDPKAPHVHRSIRDRMLVTLKRIPRQRPLNLAHTDIHGDDIHLWSAAAEAIEALRQAGKSALEAKLATEYDVLERHTLLKSASRQVDTHDASQTEKDQLKNQLAEMMSDLMDMHGDVIRDGLRDAHAFENALGAMDALSRAGEQGHDTGALHELRALYGAKGNSRFETPFTPLALAQSLKNKFGAENFSHALGGLRSKMAAKLRSDPAATIGPRLWLSLSDAACFNVVQSCFAIAGDLRRALSTRAQIAPRETQVATAMALLGVAEAEGDKASALVEKIVNRKGLKAMQQTQMYLLLRQAIEKLAITMWPQDRLGQRLALLDELRALAFGASARLPALRSPAVTLEQTLRDHVARKSEYSNDNAQEGGP